MLFVTFVQHTHLFAAVYHTYKTLNERQKGREDESFSLEVWGVSHTRLSFLTSAEKFLFQHTKYLPAHKDLFLQVTSGPSQSAQVKHRLALLPIKKPGASQKLTLLNLHLSWFAALGLFQ